MSLWWGNKWCGQSEKWKTGHCGHPWPCWPPRNATVKQEADLLARNKRCGHPLDLQFYWFQTSHHPPLFFVEGCYKVRLWERVENINLGAQHLLSSTEHLREGSEDWTQPIVPTAHCSGERGFRKGTGTASLHKLRTYFTNPPFFLVPRWVLMRASKGLRMTDSI